MDTSWTAGLVLALGVSASLGAPLTLHVAPDGNDTWSGRLARPNGGRTDGPLASLTGARDALRRLREQGPLAGPVEVLLQSGTYRIAEPLTFDGRDGGSAEAPITYAAAPGAQPVVSGGRPITGWRQGEGNLWVADVPEVKAGDWYFHQLFVNGHRAVRARTPNKRLMQQEFLRMAGPLPGIDPHAQRGKPEASIGFVYQNDDLKRWDNFADVNVFVYHSWTTSVHWIDQLDPDKHEVRFTNHCGWPFGYWERNARYYVENLFEALDDPGEWYLNRQTGQLFYSPLPGEDMARAEVVAPVATQLLRLAGDAEAGMPLSHLTFRGIAFQHADWQHPKDEVLDGQSGMFCSGAIQTWGARDCTFEGCEIAHVGEYGIRLDRGSQNVTIRQCHVHDLGAGGVRIGETGSPPNEQAACDHNSVDNCFLHDGGHVFQEGCGIIINRASYNTLTHNEICDFLYSGLSIGWSWGYAATSAHHNVAEYNHVHHLGWAELSDMGGIYTLGIAPGTRINHNVFHDIRCYQYGGWALYTDEGSTGVEMAYNVCYNTTDAGFHQHYGENNHIHNNVLAFSSRAQIVRSRHEEHNSFNFDHNIVVMDNGTVYGGSWAAGNLVADHNLYWDVSGEEPDFAGGTFAEWQAKGNEAGSRLADPLFVDAARRDFRLKPGSPALALGFEPIDTSTVGLYGAPEWVALPAGVKRPLMTFPEPPQPKPVSDDFEATAVGQPPAGGATATQGENGAALLVTDETAESGRHSLKFLDAPGQTRTWNPHLFYRPEFRTGTVTGTFDLRVEPGAKLYHEWRDARNPYLVGPSLHVEPDGSLLVGGKPLLKLPAGQWVHFEVRCRLGRSADGTFDLAVALPGQAAHVFMGLACVSANFRELMWYGWVSDATEARVFYLDNLRLAPAD